MLRKGKPTKNKGVASRKNLIEIKEFQGTIIWLMYLELLISSVYVDPFYGFPVTPMVSYLLLYYMVESKKERKWLEWLILIITGVFILDDLYKTYLAYTTYGVSRILLMYTLRGVIVTVFHLFIYKEFKLVKKVKGW